MAHLVAVLENPRDRQAHDWDSRTGCLRSERYTGYNTCIAINPRRGWGSLKYNEGASSEAYAEANNNVCEFINIKARSNLKGGTAFRADLCDFRNEKIKWVIKRKTNVSNILQALKLA